MNRRDAVLAVRSQLPMETVSSPAQLQKALRLISRNAQVFDERQGLNFTPYDYGPFDKRVYDSC